MREIRNPKELEEVLHTDTEKVSINGKEFYVECLNLWYNSYSHCYGQDEFSDADIAFLKYAEDLYEDTQRYFVQEGDKLLPKNNEEIKLSDKIFDYAYFDVTEKVHDFMNKFGISLEKALEVESWGTDDEDYIKERLEEGY